MIDFRYLVLWFVLLIVCGFFRGVAGVRETGPIWVRAVSNALFAFGTVALLFGLGILR